MIKYYTIVLVVMIGLFSACKNDKNEVSDSIIEKEQKEIDSKINPSLQQIGLEIAFTTKAQLGKNLMGTMNERGAKAALEFCNIKAIPLTDSMAIVHKAIIKRVSDKLRNSSNKANKTELESIKAFKNILSKNEEMAPIIETKNDSISFYYPIITNAMCLKCHGVPNKDISPETIISLKNLYPNDNAIGYTENQVRGIWSIQFKKR